MVVVNLSSQAYAGIVRRGPGEYREITPASRQRVAGTAGAATLPAVFLAPWEFRVFRRATP